MEKMRIGISGLHCRACEIVTEDSLKEIKGVDKVRVNHKNGQAEISYVGRAPKTEEIARRLEEAGYSLANEGERENQEKSWPLSSWLSLILFAILLYWLLTKASFLDPSAWLGSQAFSLPLALLIGLVAGVSTCLALVGGLVLGLNANTSKHSDKNDKPSLWKANWLFQAGRIIGFFILGGLLGLVGSSFKISPTLNGWLSILVGLVILALGLKLLNISPFFNRFELAWPKSWGRRLKSRSPIILGALTFFLPCGFTQAMQVYALGSGDFLTGGLVMAFFALGTAPGLLGLAGLASLKRRTLSFFRIIGAVVIVFGVINIGNGWQLSKITLAAGQAPTETSVQEEGVQIVRMTESGRGYSPNSFTIKRGQPVRWIIDAQAPYSCASALIVPSLKIQKQLKAGENIIEFTPQETGTIPFSCSMGMYRGKFIVVD